MSRDGFLRINGDRISGLVISPILINGVFLGVKSPTHPITIDPITSSAGWVETQQWLVGLVWMVGLDGWMDGWILWGSGHYMTPTQTSCYTPRKTNECPLKINGWKMYFLLK